MKKDHNPQTAKFIKEAKFYILLTVLAFVRALMQYVFIVPNGFAPGGITGISSILYNAILPYDAHLANTVFSPAVTSLVLNIPLLIVSFVVLNKKFAFNTLIVVSLFSGFMAIFSAVDFPQFIGSGMESGYMLLASLAAGVGTGICLGVMLKHNMSLGGTDILGRVIYKKNPFTDVQWIIFICDCVVVVAAGGLGFIGMDKNADATIILTAILSPMLYSFISLFMTSQMADVIQTGMQSSLVFNIISDEYIEIADRITTRMHRGVTVLTGVGHYTGKENKMLVCVVSKKQINTVKAIISECDPVAFVFITKTREVNGNGFTFKSGS